VGPARRRRVCELAWWAATLMLKRYGKKALDESAARADELAAQDDYNGAAVWRRPKVIAYQGAIQTKDVTKTFGLSLCPIRSVPMEQIAINLYVIEDLSIA
jgi:hypothetical protein